MDELVMLNTAYGGFVALIALEAGWSYATGKGYYHFAEAVTNVGHGIAYQTFDFFTAAALMVPFNALSTHAPVQLPVESIWAWILGLFAYDLCSYWSHRHHHEIGFLWAIHGVHHAAQDFNLAAALRQPLFQRVFSWLWRLPLALFMPLKMFIGIVVFDFLYQFLQHTRFVGKLGPLEWVMNTPSHHRVHHGTEPEYIDKNYGGIFIIWDRIFGTFEEERQEPTYGLTQQMRTLSPLFGNLSLYADLVQASGRATGSDRLRLWLAGPGKLPALAPGAPRFEVPILEDAQLSARVGIYIALSSILATAALTALILSEDATATLQLTLTLSIAASLAGLGAAMEGERSPAGWWGLAAAAQAGALLGALSQVL